jgi:hypothetical protein
MPTGLTGNNPIYAGLWSVWRPVWDQNEHIVRPSSALFQQGVSEKMLESNCWMWSLKIGERIPLRTAMISSDSINWI